MLRLMRPDSPRHVPGLLDGLGCHVTASYRDGHRDTSIFMDFHLTDLNE